MKSLKVRSTVKSNKGTTRLEYTLMIALIAAICAGAFYTMEDITAHMGPAETTVSP